MVQAAKPLLPPLTPAPNAVAEAVMPDVCPTTIRQKSSHPAAFFVHNNKGLLLLCTVFLVYQMLEVHVTSFGTTLITLLN